MLEETACCGTGTVIVHVLDEPDEVKHSVQYSNAGQPSSESTIQRMSEQVSPKKVFNVKATLVRVTHSLHNIMLSL